MDPHVESSNPQEVIRNGLQLLVSRQWPFPPLDLTTIKFLKSRYDPIYQVHYVTVQDATAQRWCFTFFLVKEADQWYVKTQGGSPESGFNEPLELHDHPWIRLETLFILNEFYAFGEVFDKGNHIVRVRLRDAGSFVLEDSVQDGIVLFYSHQLPTSPPIQLELSTPSNIIVSRQTETLGSFPSVTKEV